MVQPFPTNPQLSLNKLLDVAQGCSFVVSAPTTAAGTTETPLLYLSVPTGQSKSAAIWLRKYASQTASDSAIFKTYANPVTVTSGTPITPVNLRIDASSPVSVCSALISPSAVSNGTLLTNDGIGQSELLIDQPIIVDPGNSLLITATASATSDKIVAELTWSELNV